MNKQCHMVILIDNDCIEMPLTLSNRICVYNIILYKSTFHVVVLIIVYHVWVGAEMIRKAFQIEQSKLLMLFHIISVLLHTISVLCL